MYTARQWFGFLVLVEVVRSAGNINKVSGFFPGVSDVGPKRPSCCFLTCFRRATQSEGSHSEPAHLVGSG